MSEEQTRRRHPLLDLLVVAGVVLVGVLVVLWVFHAVLGILGFAFKVALFVLVLAVLWRVVRLLRRR